MVSIHKNCQNCGDKLPASSNWNRKFCGDRCRVAWHREQKKPKFEEKYNKLVRSIYDSIYRLDRQAKAAYAKSEDKELTIEKRQIAYGMFCEKDAISKELKLLLEINGSPDSWKNFLATKDPITYD